MSVKLYVLYCLSVRPIVGELSKFCERECLWCTCGGLWANTDAREVPLQQVPDEGGLASGVLAHQQDHGLGIEVRILWNGKREGG